MVTEFGQEQKFVGVDRTYVNGKGQPKTSTADDSSSQGLVISSKYTKEHLIWRQEPRQKNIFR